MFADGKCVTYVASEAKLKLNEQKYPKKDA